MEEEEEEEEEEGEITFAGEGARKPQQEEERMD